MKKETNVFFMEKGNLEECREGSLDQFSVHVGAENGRRYVCKKKKKECNSKFNLLLYRQSSSHWTQPLENNTVNF